MPPKKVTPPASKPNRRWMVTDNTIAENFSTEDWKSKFNEKVKFATWQKEKAASGKVHIQAYLKLTTPMRLPQLKEMLGMVHAEPAKGNDEQCIAYCSKEDTKLEGPFTYGECDKQGTRRDLDEVGTKLLAGSHAEDIAIENTAVYIRYHRGIHAAEVAIQAKKAKTWRDVDVQVYWGPSGTGKTRTCYALHPDVFRVHTSGNIWFDGYSGQTAILFDDFYGQVGFAYMLQLLDGYPMRVPIKGGFVAASWTTVYITSNTHPDEWWSKSNVPEACRLALKRRLRTIDEFSDSRALTPVAPKPTFIPPKPATNIPVIPVPSFDLTGDDDSEDIEISSQSEASQNSEKSYVFEDDE